MPYLDNTDSYIDHAAADVFFALLAERISNEADQTVNLSVDIVENGIEICPDQESGDIVIRGNELWVGKHQLVLHQLRPFWLISVMITALCQIPILNMYFWLNTFASIKSAIADPPAPATSPQSD